MAIPSRVDAERILASYRLPPELVVHARGVAAVAAEAARLLAARGVAVDPALAEVAGLLHDIDKLQTRHDGERHGALAAGWLAEMGHPELSAAVAAHPVVRLLDPATAPRDWASKVVNLADRYVDQGFASIDQRIDGQRGRYPAFDAVLERAREPAHALEAEVAAAAGLGVEELIARLRAAAEASR